MLLGVNLGYWGAGNDAENLALARAADELGYDVCWAAEAYGSDAATVLSWVAAQTRQIHVGSAVFQIPARSAAMTAMTAATLDALSGGRFRLGLGVSGPQVSEGWHGVRFDAPLARTREYVDVVRMALARQSVRYQGDHITLPLPDGPGKALRLTVHPVREHIPVYLAAVGPKNLELCGRIADGWQGIFFSPEHSGAAVDALRAGRRAAGHDGPEPLAGFDVMTSVPVVVQDDPEAGADLLRGYYALYIGGMGSREKNFYHQLATRMGFGAAADRVQDHFLVKEHREAMAAVPFELIDATALLGSPARITERIGAFAAAGVSTLTVASFATTLAERMDTLSVVQDAARAADVLSVRATAAAAR